MPARLMPTFSHVFRIIAYQSVFFPSLFPPFMTHPDRSRIILDRTLASLSSLSRNDSGKLPQTRAEARSALHLAPIISFLPNFAFAFCFLLSSLFLFISLFASYDAILSFLDQSIDRARVCT
jgi:hypothetical protein